MHWTEKIEIEEETEEALILSVLQDELSRTSGPGRPGHLRTCDGPAGPNHHLHTSPTRTCDEASVLIAGLRVHA